MTSFVLDTSVAGAWYLPEAFSDAARTWQQRSLSGSVHFVVPSLHYWEFGNVLRTYVRRRALDAALAQEIYATHLEAPLQIVEPDRLAVLEVALEYDATVYDAVYIALALQLDAPLVTAERSTTPWLSRLGRRAVSVSA